MYDVIIIGAGASGLTSALYCARSNMKTLVVEKSIYGGLMQETAEIENFPGFNNISGEDLSDLMYNQAISHGAEYTFGNVKLIQPMEDGTHALYIDGNVFTTKSVIIATGASPKKLGVKGEEEFAGRGVSYCAICDGAFFKDKVVTVIGGGDSAFEEANYLTNYTDKVNIVHRNSNFKAQDILLHRAIKNKGIFGIATDVVITEIIGTDKVEKVKAKSMLSGLESYHDTDGVFIYIGQKPSTKQFENLGILNDEGYIVTDEKMKTSVDGIFAVGDVREKMLRQIVTATGDGSIGAISAKHYVDSL